MFITHNYYSYVPEVGHILNTITFLVRNTFFELITLDFLKGSRHFTVFRQYVNYSGLLTVFRPTVVFLPWIHRIHDPPKPGMVSGLDDISIKIVREKLPARKPWITIPSSIFIGNLLQLKSIEYNQEMLWHG
jgi:hypothetical protein